MYGTLYLAPFTTARNLCVAMRTLTMALVLAAHVLFLGTAGEDVVPDSCWESEACGMMPIDAQALQMQGGFVEADNQRLTTKTIPSSPSSLQNLGQVSTWLDTETATGEMPTYPWGTCNSDGATKVGIHVRFQDGTESEATYEGVPSWNTNSINLSPTHSTGFLSSCVGLHFLYNNGATLPMAWSSCSFTYSNNFDLDFSEYQNSNFRASTSGWGAARFALYCDTVAAGTTTTTPAPTPAPANAVGDPHLTNVLGQRFDLTQPGKHVFILIPKGADAQDTLLRVDADIEHIGNACADMYIQYLNITGKWADEQRIGGYHYYAQEDAGRMATNWMHVGEVDLKVVWGHTIEGIKYMNLFAKKLGHTGFPVGGLLGEDDHTIASSPNPSCEKAISLITGAPQVHGGSTARADFS